MGRPAGEHLVEDHAQTINVGGGPDTSDLSARLLGRHVARGADDVAVTGPDGRSDSNHLATPKSAILGTPSGVIKMFDGLRSQCTMPWRWA